jgi:hypothetical protein
MNFMTLPGSGEKVQREGYREIELPVAYLGYFGSRLCTSEAISRRASSGSVDLSTTLWR